MDFEVVIRKIGLFSIRISSFYLLCPLCTVERNIHPAAETNIFWAENVAYFWVAISFYRAPWAFYSTHCSRTAESIWKLPFPSDKILKLNPYNFITTGATYSPMKYGCVFEWIVWMEVMKFSNFRLIKHNHLLYAQWNLTPLHELYSLTWAISIH